jgi:asparagine synthase (glutamine-hydrolysing)
VLVNLYEEEGMAAFNRLRGMFGVALWDTFERELLLVRDQLGIKPLFYAADCDALLFGSEIKSILAAMPGRLTVDAQALDAVLAYTYIPAPLTIWKDIRKLRPGHYLRWRNGRWAEHRYWDLLDAADSPPPTVEELRDALDDTVRAHLVSDVEVGAFLSGGLDSSTIVARMQRCMETKIRAFSVRFDTKSHLFDETGYARQLQQAYGFELQVENLPPSGYAAITDAIRAFDEPFADDSLMPSDAISALAARAPESRPVRRRWR